VFALVFLNSESIFPVTVGMLKLTATVTFSAFKPALAGLASSDPIVILFIFAIAGFPAAILSAR